jgi:hypothetical protein
MYTEEERILAMQRIEERMAFQELTRNVTLDEYVAYVKAQLDDFVMYYKHNAKDYPNEYPETRQLDEWEDIELDARSIADHEW